MRSSMLYQMERYGRAFFEAPKKYPSGAVLLASYPKSGNSWFRFVVSNVNSIIEGGEKVTFHTIEDYSPVIRGNRDLRNTRLVSGCPVFLKTHFPFTPFFKSVDSVVIVRNPFYVIPSYHNYLNKARGKSVSRDLEEFFSHWRYGFNAWAGFMKSWEGHATLIVKYEDLQLNPVEEISAIYERLGYVVDPQIIAMAIERSSRNNMKKSLESDGDPHNENQFDFVRRAGENKGVEHLRGNIISNPLINREFIEQAGKYGYL